jgi:hypothetical protein
VREWAQQHPHILNREAVELPVHDRPVLLPQAEQPAGPTAYQMAQIAKLLQEKAKRQIEALRLYVPLDHIQLFHSSVAPERIIRGSNQAGKTLGAAVEFARAVTNQDPFCKYPSSGIAYAVGKDLRHCGKVMYRKLFHAGAFKIIRDQCTGLWRSFRPWLPEDAGREKEAKLAPPLIPHRFVKSVSWENKAAGIPNLVNLHTGWEIAFFSSDGKPPQGTIIDLAWFDEEIKDGDWYPEIAARLMTRRGRFFWSATPQAGTEQLFALHERAEIEAELEHPSVVEIVALLDDNRHLDELQKKGLYDKLTSEEERRVRIGGEFALLSTKVYPEFSLTAHGCDPFEVPFEWTSFAVIDPGRQVCAVLFASIPPPEDEKHGGHVYLWDELYLRDCDAAKFGREMKPKAGHRPFQAFIIDHHGSRVTDSGSGKSVEQQYSDALRENSVRCARTGHGFIWGSDDVDAGILAVKSWLHIRESGTPKLKVFRTLRAFLDEMKRYRNARDKFGEVIDKPLQRNNHLMDCLRYLAMFNPKWQKRKKADEPDSYAVAALKAKMERKRAKAGFSGIHLGPGRKC